METINITRIKDRIAVIKLDDRLALPHANVVVNAPLALIQVALATELHTLETVLGLERTPIPFKKKRK